VWTVGLVRVGLRIVLLVKSAGAFSNGPTTPEAPAVQTVIEGTTLPDHDTDTAEHVAAVSHR
jgi:hypothetical protein